jgi:hypothetical protein
VEATAAAVNHDLLLDMYHLFPMSLLKTAVPPAEAQRTQNSQRSQNADARSSMADIISSGICRSLAVQKAWPSANPCLLHLSRRGSHRSSMKQTAIVFPECCVPDIQAPVVSRRPDFSPAELQQQVSRASDDGPIKLVLIDQFAASNAS